MNTVPLRSIYNTHVNIDSYIGWDIGGAHLKMAEIDKAGKVIFADQSATPLWKGIGILHQSLEQSRKLVSGKSVLHAITTTAELVDIFPDRITGVNQLKDCITGIFDKNPVRFYSGKTGWVSADCVTDYAIEIASANWYATASFIARYIDKGILMDIGSTTTDIIAFSGGRLLNQGYSDYERMSTGELVYTGIIRTPVMALVHDVNVNGKQRPVIAEHFATMADVYRLTGDLDETDDMQATADGAGKSLQDSARRLARMVGKDIYGDESIQEWMNVAKYIAEIQQNRILQCCQRIISCLEDNQDITIIGAGAGRFLAAKLAGLMDCRYLDFADILEVADELKPSVARSATAVAVAQLARLSD